MPELIVPLFKSYADEGVIVGRLVAGYGTLESALVSCAANAKGDLDSVFKAMFRVRGETRRIDKADVIGRPAYRALSLEEMFSDMIADMRFCLKIRNQYAHCHWTEDFNFRLGFVNWEEIAKENATVTTDFSGLTTHYLDTALLTTQEYYFVYVRKCLLYLNYRAGKSSIMPTEKPEKVQRPALSL